MGTFAFAFARKCQLLLASAAALLLAGCYSPLDIIGVQESVKQQKEDGLQDDDIADKNPVFDPNRTIIERFDGCEFELNKSGSVTRLSIAKLEGEDAALSGRVFPTRAEALAALGERPVMPSMEVVNGALKPFNDGLYAAVELAAEDGSFGSPINKAALFRDLLAELVAHYETGPASDRDAARQGAAHLAAALELGGETPTAPAEIASEGSQLADRFRSMPAESRPIGFYTWQPELERIFQRDRFLQGATIGDQFAGFAATALMLDQNPSLLDQYALTLDLYAGLTNPSTDLSALDLIPHLTGASLNDLDGIAASFANEFPTYGGDPACSPRLAYLPASTSPETELFRDLYCRDMLDPNVDVIDILIDAIRAGEVDLTPTEDSGWYDRQLFALETLLLPERGAESDYLLLTKEYKQKLVETFKSLITQTRETHVKQLARGSMTTSAPVEIREVDVYPLLPVEPFPTFYLRTARAYAFLRLMLRGVVGDEFLSSSARLLETGERSEQSLGDELAAKTQLLYGLHIVAARSIGMATEITAEELVDFTAAEAEAAARLWLEDWHADADINRDPRVIVPVAQLTADTWNYWAVIGVKVVRVDARFYQGYEPIAAPLSYECKLRDFVPYRPYLLMEQMVEVQRVGEPPTRDEFRTICDAHETTDEITEALGNAP